MSLQCQIVLLVVDPNKHCQLAQVTLENAIIIMSKV